MLRSAIIGCGAIAQVHAAVLARMPETTLCACADIRPDRARAMAEKTGCRAYESLGALLSAERVDVVHICTPHPLHTPLAAEAVARGVHVLTEKPPAVDEAQWETFRALETPKTRVGVCFQNRYNPPVEEARRLMASGEAGAALGARALVSWRRDAAYYTESDWRGSWTTEGGGALINQSIHTLDLLCYLLGKPTAQETRMANHSLRGVIEVEDSVDAYIRFGDVPALFYATNAYCESAPVSVEIVSERMTLQILPDALVVRRPDGSAERPAFAFPEALGKGYWGNGHIPCIEDFYRCVQSGAPFRNDAKGVEDTVRLMFSMYAPYRGRTVGA